MFKTGVGHDVGMAELIKSQVIRIADLTVASPKISGKHFQDCLILGPAVLAFSGEGTLAECSFEGDPDALLWEVPATRQQIIGVIEIEDCEFVKCRFQGVGFAGLKDFTDDFKANLTESRR